MKRTFLMTLIAVAAMMTSCKDDDKMIGLEGITISKPSVTLKPEMSEELTLTFFPADADNKSVNWKSSKDEIATVDNNGKVTAQAVGNATITATSVANPALTATCNIIVSWDSKTVSGNVDGIWEKKTTVLVTGHVIVPAGKSLTIEEGCEVIFAENLGLELYVEGNLYCKGTAANPVLFTVNEASRTETNIHGKRLRITITYIFSSFRAASLFAA